MPPGPPRLYRSVASNLFGPPQRCSAKATCLRLERGKEASERLCLTYQLKQLKSGPFNKACFPVKACHALRTARAMPAR